MIEPTPLMPIDQLKGVLFSLERWPAEPRHARRQFDDISTSVDDPGPLFAPYYATAGLVLAWERKTNEAVDAFSTALLHSEHDTPAILPGMVMFNIGLTLMVGNRPPAYGTPLTLVQFRSLNEAVGALAGAVHSMQNSKREFMRSHTGSALALMAEALLLLGRHDEALEMAEQAIPLLDSALGNQARRLMGVYGIQQKLVPGWQHPAGYNAGVNPPGTYNCEELLTYRGAF